MGIHNAQNLIKESINHSITDRSAQVVCQLEKVICTVARFESNHCFVDTVARFL